MPNHVHVLVTLLDGLSLSGVVHSWKSYTAKQANKLLGRNGAFWHADSFDRFMRDEDHFATTLDYIHWNPVKAGLCAQAGGWEWSSYHTREYPQPWLWIVGPCAMGAWGRRRMRRRWECIWCLH